MLEVRLTAARTDGVTFIQRVSTYESAEELADRIDRDLADAMKNPLWCGPETEGTSHRLELGFWEGAWDEARRVFMWRRTQDPRVS